MRNVLEPRAAFRVDCCFRFVRFEIETTRPEIVIIGKRTRFARMIFGTECHE